MCHVCVCDVCVSVFWYFRLLNDMTRHTAKTYKSGVQNINVFTHYACLLHWTAVVAAAAAVSPFSTLHRVCNGDKDTGASTDTWFWLYYYCLMRMFTVPWLLWSVSSFIQLIIIFVTLCHALISNNTRSMILCNLMFSFSFNINLTMSPKQCCCINFNFLENSNIWNW